MERKGALLSGLLHIGIILLMGLGLPFFLQKELDPPPLFSVDFIDASHIEEDLQEKTEMDAKEDPKENLIPEAKAEVEAKNVEAPTAPPEETSEESAVGVPDILSLLDTDVIEELNTPQPEAKATPPKPKDKPKKIAQAKPKKKKSAFDSLLQNVTDKKPKDPPVKPASKTAKKGEQDITKVLTSAELSALRQQVASCWNVPAGARDANDLVVDIHVELDPKGLVKVAQVVGGNQSHPYFRAGSESAVRALKNPRCNPLKIPPHRRDVMQSFTFRFNPGMMF